MTGIIAHGSAVKGGAIPGFSDADFMVFLTAGCFDDEANLLDDLVFAIQERSGGLPWREAGYGYLQAYYYDPARMPDWWTGPAPGSYRVLHGSLPAGFEATPDRLRASAGRWLRDLRRSIAGDVRNFADSMDDQVPRRLRLIATSVTPAIFCLATLDAEDPAALWAKTKFEALAELSRLYRDEPGPAMAADLYGRLGRIYAAPGFDIPAGKEAFRIAVRFLRWVDSVAQQRLAALSGEA